MSRVVLISGGTRLLALAVLLVGGFGLALWVTQMLTGPPGPPG